jgi:hypothetical protein
MELTVESGLIVTQKAQASLLLRNILVTNEEPLKRKRKI